MISYSPAWNKTHQRGFTLFLATLVASAVLVVGSAIYSLAVKGINLSALGRDSQFAFYAADTGAECALYWDIHNNYNYFDVIAPTDPLAADPHCDGKSLGASGRTGVYPQTMSFNFNVAPRNDCVDVIVTKTQDSGTLIVSTKITANGYNVPCAQKDTSARALQRTEEVDY